MEARRTEYSETDVLRYLEQSALVLDDIWARGQQGPGALSADEQRAMSRNLSVVSNVLEHLCRQIVPAMLADGCVAGLLRQPAALELFARLEARLTGLEQHFRVRPAALN